ncbi:peptigoglycan-binding protein LysM [Aestuariirhabdus litorea]|uniref:Peptigoglycan-binding protein LysM n=1 Tax=Aestuariirhabdus litorea TaxID=2528527 RepID=A0A3P3VTB6_9GAMM|nr:peptigoglycan-binding protein LysM [Aestuariirhabdus litorea]
MGEINLRSALNQPLNAEIELIELKGLGQNEVLPSLASREDFTLAGVERDFFLTDLKFATVVRPNGTAYVQVTSRKPVREPYLNFLVELHWPNGRLLREYTLLLDPPTFTEEVPAPVAPPAAEKVEPVASSRPVAPVAPAKPRAEAPAPTPAPQPRVERAEVGGGTYTTSSNDTLWEIATRHRPSSDVSVQQTMMAIQQVNPDAFINQNINLLKKGQVLRLPTREETLQLTQRQAIAEVSLQNQQWRDQRNLGAAPLDAARRDAVEEPAGPTSSEGTLRLASASETGTTTSGSDNGSSTSAADLEALQNELAINQEKLEKAVRESGEVSSQLAELEGQVETLQRLLSLKDEQLAALQAQLAAKGEAPAEVDYNYAEEKPAPEADGGQVVAEESAEAPAVMPAKPEPAAQPKPEPKPEAAKPAPVKPAPAPVVEEPSLLDEILQNPIYMAAGGGVLVLLLALLLLSRRRSGATEPESDFEPGDELVDEEPKAAFEADLPQDEVGPAEQDDELSLEGEGEEVAERTTAQTSDAIGEADIYIAYGRYNQAVDLLTNAIEQEPGRADLRVKLLEAYAEMKDAESFVKQENELSALGDSIAMQEAESLKAKFPAGALAAVGAVAASAMSELDVDDLDEALSMDELGSADEAVEFSLDDLELDAPADTDSSGVEDAEVENRSDDDDFMNLAGDADASEALEFDLDEGSLELAEDLVDSGDDLDADLDQALGSDLDVELDELDEVDDTEFELDDDLSLDSELEDELQQAAMDSAAEPAGELELDAELDDVELEDFGFDMEEDSTEGSELELDDEFDLSLDDEADQEVSGEAEVSLESSDEEGLPDIEFDLGSDDLESELDESESIELASNELDLDEVEAEAELDDIEFDLGEVSLEEAAEEQASESAETAADLDDSAMAELDADLEGFDLAEELPEELEEPEVVNEFELDDLAEDEVNPEAEVSESVEADDLLADSEATDSEPEPEVDEFDRLAQDLSADPDMAALDAATESLASEFDVEDDSMDDEFDFLSGTNETATKLDLARAYVDMGDVEGARDILEEVLKEGDEAQLKEAQELLDKI